MKSPWVKYKNSEGKTYYYNKEKHISQWDVPKDFVPSGNVKWLKNIAADGTESYYNIKTSEIVFQKPKDFDKITQYSTEMKVSKQIHQYQSMKDSKSHHKSSSNPTEKVLDDDSKKKTALKQSSIVESDSNDRIRMRKFKDLLAENIKASNITWEEACEIIKNDIRFTLLTQYDMKKVFMSYKSKMIQEEKLSENDKIEINRKKLEEFLLNDNRINSSLKYPEIDEIYEHEDIWTDLPDVYRRKVVEKINPQLLNRELKQLKFMRDSNISKLKNLLKKMQHVNYRITWAATQQLLLENEEFMNDQDLQNMDKEDALNVFQEHIMALEKVHKDELDFIETAKKLHYAQCRDNFWQLLHKLHNQGKIHKDTLWKHIYPILEDETDFKNMLGAPGSSPLDIFKIFQFDMRTNYLKDMETIHRLIKSNSIELNLRMSFDAFYSIIRRYNESSLLRRSNVLMYYDMTMSKLKNIKRKVDAFTPYEKKRLAFKKLLLKMGNKVIKRDTKYNDVIRRISDTKEFKEFNDENEKYKIFKKIKNFLNYDSKDLNLNDLSDSSATTDSESLSNFTD